MTDTGEPERGWGPDWDLIGLEDGPFIAHAAIKCEGHRCAIHDPSPHPLATAPTRWASAVRLLAR